MLKDNEQRQCVIFVLFLFCLMKVVFPQSAWQKMADIPEGRTTAVDDINGKIYIMGAGSNLFTEYNPETDTYKKLPNMPLERHSSPSGAAVNGLFYTVGGNYGGDAFRTVHAYDPVTNLWKTVADMPTGRMALQVCACGGKLVTGGAYYIPKAFEIYDPITNSWEKRSAAAPPMAGQAMCSYNGKVYCFGGCYGPYTVWEYDPETDTWARKADMPTGRSCASAACVNGKIYVIGGTADGVAPWIPPLDLVEAYDPEEDQWYINYPSMPTSRFSAGACVVDSLIYVIGGFQGNMGAGAQKVNQVFNPALVTGTAFDGPALNDPPLVWQLQYTGVEGSSTMQWLSPVAAVDESVAWAGGNTGVYLRTTDGGENWLHGFVPGAQNHTFYSIAAINADIAYFAAAKDPFDTRIYKTVDGGTSWEMQYQNTKSAAFINSIAFWDADNGIAVSDAVEGTFLILTTHDGGANWMQTPAENIPPPLADEWAGCTGDGGTGVAVAGDRYAWFCTAYGKKNGQPLRAYRSSDRGQTWNVSEMPFPLDGTVRGVTTLIFQDSLIGFAGLGGSGARARGENLAKTIDGGKTWTLITPFISGLRMNTLCVVPGTNFKIMVASTTAGLICSPDGGDSWQKIDSDKFYGISFVSPTCG